MDNFPTSAVFVAPHAFVLNAILLIFLPSGASTVIVPEYTRRRGDDAQIRFSLLPDVFLEIVTLIPSTVHVVAFVKSPSLEVEDETPGKSGNKVL
nr:hypothetical protein [Prevotella sp.]